MKTNSRPYQVAAFYHFVTVPADELKGIAATLEKEGTRLGLRGLVIFATEGINGTVSGESREIIETYLGFVEKRLQIAKLEAKWSDSAIWPFRKFKVRKRKEIVTLGKPEVQPLTPHSSYHLSPDDWDKAMETENVVVLDTRNWYETKIGKFKGAVDPQIEEFRDFSGFLDQSGIPKDQKVLIYCTGGIRCEKAIVDMNNKGFNNVYQLDGGILNYLAQKPHRNFEGECFVFDHRVAVDQNLDPSVKYKMCPHCGQPAEQPIACVRCDSPAVICSRCYENSASERSHLTCSKNCAHHTSLAPNKKGRSQNQGYRFGKAKKEAPRKGRRAPTEPKSG